MIRYFFFFFCERFLFGFVFDLLLFCCCFQTHVLARALRVFYLAYDGRDRCCLPLLSAAPQTEKTRAADQASTATLKRATMLSKLPQMILMLAMCLNHVAESTACEPITEERCRQFGYNNTKIELSNYPNLEYVGVSYLVSAFFCFYGFIYDFVQFFFLSFATSLKRSAIG